MLIIAVLLLKGLQLQKYLRSYCHQVEGHTVQWIIMLLLTFSIWQVNCRLFENIILVFFIFTVCFYKVEHWFPSACWICVRETWDCKCVVFFHCSSVHLSPVWRLCGCLTAFPLWCTSSGTERRSGRGKTPFLLCVTVCLLCSLWSSHLTLLISIVMSTWIITRQYMRKKSFYLEVKCQMH